MKIPMPKWSAVDESDEEEEEEQGPVRAVCKAPAYPHRASGGFVPRDPEDFGDGGAYPEIHVAQYPLGLGKKGKVSLAT